LPPTRKSGSNGVAEKIGITERSAQRIVADLIQGGYVQPVKSGRRNHYRLRLDLPLRHPLEQENDVSVLVRLLGRKAPGVKGDPKTALP
jgi:hypothetical protein